MINIAAIPLTQDLYALVDREDYEELNKHKWYAHSPKGFWYARRQMPRQGNKRCAMSMHHEILNIFPSVKIDHINGCGLDNRRCNLRICSHQQNMQNRRPNKNTSSVYKGVHWDKKTKKWQARITYNRTLKHLGLFANEISAARAYDNVAKELFGEFAHLNFEER